MAVPKKPENNMVDTRHGDKFPLYPSGLAPVYVKKKVSLLSDNSINLFSSKLIRHFLLEF